MKSIPVSALRLDPDNPRFFDLKALQGRKELTQEELKNEILDDDEIITLGKAIKKAGVAEPIWVKDSGDGSYLVLEGNRRTVILQQLLEEKQKPPPGGTRPPNGGLGDFRPVPRQPSSPHRVLPRGLGLGYVFVEISRPASRELSKCGGGRARLV